MKNTLDLLRKEIKKLQKEHYSDDKRCPPEFIVSMMIDNKIVVTVLHMGFNHSQILHLEDDIKEIMQYLYNRTM